MEETELEEGEACLNKNDVDKNYDPDVALVYIDEKLEHVLGHFQKDFEGGVSAENLGSKFGGYGSFLPTYQRSPVWSHPKSPQKLQKSPHNLPLEGARGHSVSSSASVSGRHGSTALVVAKLPVPRASDDCVRREVKMPLTHPENKSDSQSDQKNFKVRIKMVSDNMSTKKNAEIYSGLGLDVSPTSSFEDSPTDCKLAREPQNLPKESPTSILKIMTSKPLHGILLLSPLHNDLICLTDKEMHFRESRAVSIRHRGSQEDSLISVNGSDSGRSNKKLVGEKKPKKSEKKAFTAELKNSNVYTTQDGVDAILKQETDVDASVCDETARKADIPRVVNRSGTKEENFHGLAKDEPRGPPSIQEDGFVGKANEKAVSCTKITHSYDDESGYPDKGGNLNGERINIPLRVDPHMSRERKGVNSELMDHAKHRSGQKSVSSVDDDKKVSSGKENSSSGSKRKSKGVQSRDAEIITDMRNAFTKTDVVSAPNSRKNTILKTHMSTSQVNDSKQDVGNPKDRYKDFFGDLEELGDDDMADDMPSVDKLSNCPTVDKGSGEFNSVSENQSSSKQINQVSRSHAYGRADSSLVPPTGYRPIPDVGAPLSQLVKEDWVCCDKCQKWRLLPAGKNPQSLPKTWLCNMLNWVDGMNRCSISEEETTKAVLALHQNFATAPPHEGQNSQNRYSGVVSSGVVDALHADQSLQDVGGRKQHGFRDVYNASSHNGSSPYIDSKKKIPQAPVKTRSLNGESHSPSLDEVDFELSGQSSGLVGQKRRHRKEKSIPLANPLEGDSKSSKIRISSENNQEYHKAPKKLKAGSVHIDEDWKSDNGGSALKVCRSSTNGLSMNKSREHQHKHEDHPKDSKRDLKVSVRNSEDRTQFSSDASLLRTENQIDIDVKKRKFSEYEEIQLYTTSRSNAGHRLEDRRDSLEETSESNHRKEKKARVPNSGEKESSMSKGSGRIDNKGGSVKDQQAGKDRVYSQSRRSLDVVDLVQKDIGYTQPPVAATSSSSKVSSSRKSKTNFQERKGSPVESVSSSPLRVLNQDKFMLTRRDLGGKRDSEEAVMVASSPRKCSNGEDGAQIDQSRMVQKNVTITTTKQGSLESSMHDIQDRNQSHISRRKALQEAVSTHDVTDTFKSDQYPCKPLISEHCPNDESGKRNQYHSHGSRRKSGKGSSSRSKEKSRGTRSESEKGNLREAESNGDHVSHNENSKARSKLQEKIAINSEKIEKNICKNELAANPSTESGKREAQSNLASFDSSNIRRFISNHGSEHNHPMDRNNEKSLKRFPTDKTDRVDVIGKGKPHSLPPSGRGQNDMTRCPQPINGIQNDIGVNLLTVRTSDGDDALKANKQIKKSENQSGNGNQPSNSRNPTNGHKGRDIDAPSPIRRDSTSQAASNAVKEAKDLKHLADRLKNSGSILESMGLYFQAALKFLYGASLLESSNSENSKHGEAIQSMQMYSSTAKLCEFCAHEYEKLKDMASAALAYKCVEVAYLRVIYSSHSSASKDRQELQTALQIVPPGESPSSSASDVDNLNNIATSDKVTVTKGVNSTQVAGNHVIPAQNRPNFVRLLNFVQDVNFAMEASRKSRTAFGTASAREETKYREGLPSVKKALDFNFQDMEGFLRLVRLAMEAISH